MSRPPADIDEQQVRNLAERGWSGRQIAAHFGVAESVIRRRFSAVIEEARQHGAAKLIDILWQRGVKEKSDRILMHLADRLLGRVPQKIEITREQAIEFLEQDLKSRGLTDNPVAAGLKELPETKD